MERDWTAWSGRLRVREPRVRSVTAVRAARVVVRGTGARTCLAVEGLAPAVAGYLPAAWWALRRLVR